MYYHEVKEFATNYRKELQPMMKKMGFNVSVTTFKEYFDEGRLVVTINKVPKTFLCGQVSIVDMTLPNEQKNLKMLL